MSIYTLKYESVLLLRPASLSCLPIFRPSHHTVSGRWPPQGRAAERPAGRSEGQRHGASPDGLLRVASRTPGLGTELAADGIGVRAVQVRGQELPGLGRVGHTPAPFELALFRWIRSSLL